MDIEYKIMALGYVLEIAGIGNIISSYQVGIIAQLQGYKGSTLEAALFPLFLGCIGYIMGREINNYVTVQEINNNIKKNSQALKKQEKNIRDRQKGLQEIINEKGR